MDMDMPLCRDEIRRPTGDDFKTYGSVKRALLQDNKDDFVKFINRFSVEGLKYHKRVIKVLMFSEDAAKCAAAVVDGETQIRDITKIMTRNPLHTSASFCAVKITALLLERGFSADVRCDWEEYSLPHVLPLGVELHLLSKRTSFCPPENERTSAVKFTTLVFGRYTPVYLVNLRLLAMKTRDIKHEFYNYLKEGKMVAVGALLFVARSRILSSSTGKGEFSSILEMREFLAEEMTSYSNSMRLLSAGDDKLIEMEQTLVLLQILDTLGDKLAALIRQDFTPCPKSCETKMIVAASLLEDAGFHDTTSRSNVTLCQHCVLVKHSYDYVIKTFKTMEPLTQGQVSVDHHHGPLSSSLCSFMSNL